ncbi:hypothetical protein GRL14_004761 [Salmonella enterica]|nr:hypothetical protein [Salmonella enterica]EEP7681661.1 hypothetical protein [Salmonella enterica]ELL8035124.1 hypothetical protein [Salmonella enterica]
MTMMYPETLPCPVLLEPGMRFGKGVKTNTMLKALQRRAEYYAELDAMTPEERMKYNDNIEAIRQLLPQPESPVTVLCLALERMLKMHELVMNKTNAGASFYDAECIREMNLAPIQARQALTFARSILAILEVACCQCRFMPIRLGLRCCSNMQLEVYSV